MNSEDLSEQMAQFLSGRTGKGQFPVIFQSERKSRATDTTVLPILFFDLGCHWLTPHNGYLLHGHSSNFHLTFWSWVHLSSTNRLPDTNSLLNYVIYCCLVLTSWTLLKLKINLLLLNIEKPIQPSVCTLHFARK